MMQWYERLVSLDGTLSGQARSQRKVLFNVSVISAIFTVVFYGVFTPTHALLVGGAVVFVISLVAPIIMILCRLHVAVSTITVHLAGISLGLLAVDLTSRGYGQTVWPFFIIVIDLALVLRLPKWLTDALVVLMVAWLLLCSMESHFRFGLYDIPGTPSQSTRSTTILPQCECLTLPCPQSASNSVYLTFIGILVFTCDFIATRGFADEAEREQASMAHTIDVVETIAQLLAGYDVDTVATMLEEMEGRLPAKMHSALQHLEQNLRVYRPYLPAILLEQVRGETEPVCQPVAAPGTVTEEATIVFTDVRASTSIWEAAPEAMKKAMQMHNAVMRKAAAELGGYEVKTIGDAFMVAFEGVCAGVDFGLAVQEHLLDADWPPALLEQPICKRTPLWGGLTVRVGVNHGPLTVETNAVTGRVDYFGHTVNVAARLEGVCVPGAVAMLYDTWAQVNTCQPAVVGAPVLVVLRGVCEEVTICNVWPQRLQDRCQLPLCSDVAHDQESCYTASVLSSSVPGSPMLRHAPAMSVKCATVGTLKLADDNVLPDSITTSLVSLMPLLEQSAGTVLGLLAHRVVMGWNLSRQTPAHEECALRFAHRLLRLPETVWVALGLATGPLYYGDVGTATQRFLTAAGPALEASLCVRNMAQQLNQRCLFTIDTDMSLASDPTLCLHPLSAIDTTCIFPYVYALQESVDEKK